MRWILASVLLAACTPSEPVEKAPPPPLTSGEIWTGVHVVTGDPSAPEYDGLRHEDGVITHLWSGEMPPGLDGKRLDFGGATAVPGLVDAHLHLRGIGRADRQLKLLGTDSAAAVVKLVKAETNRAAGSWIRGRGWDQNDWAEQVFPNAKMLDAVAPDHPVWLSRVDGHAVWVNSKAMALAGVDASTKAPSGGEIQRAADGTPTGVFVDNAIDLIYDQLPQATDAEVRADLERGIRLCQEAGLVGVHDMGVGATSLAMLRAIEADGLGLQVWAYHGDGDDLEARIAEEPDHEGRLQVPGVKLFADGALGSRGAALLAPYSDKPGHNGLLLTPPKELKAKVQLIHNRGYQAAIHAIGDRGIRTALDAFESLEPNDRRHRVEHNQVFDLADLPRFRKLRVVASMQPTHATSDMPWAPDRLGPDRLDGAYAWRRVLDAGVPLAFGSDAPVESHAPRLGLYAAVTRQDAKGAPAGGWLPEQRLSMDEALSAFSAGAAYAVHDDGGTLRVGGRMDVTVFDKDPRAAEPKEILTLGVVRTVVGGESVYVAE
jgi:predicted amidohydrolase YtcJ